MLKLPVIAPLVAMSFTAIPAHADCHWGWYCDPSAGCGFVPFCDSPNDKPPPLQGLRPPDADNRRPVAPSAPGHSGRKPLPGYLPVNPPPPGIAGPGTDATRRSRAGGADSSGEPPQQEMGSTPRGAPSPGSHCDQWEQ